mgnify:CR=1 FL=1
MPIILGFFCLLPLLLGAVLEYLAFRLPRRRWWRALPPVLAVLLSAAIAVGRLNLWESKDASPVPQLLIVPGISMLFFLLGCLLGWRLWKYVWTPKIIDKKKK